MGILAEVICVRCQQGDSTKTNKKVAQLEVDFVANQVDRRYYVQVALGVDDPGKHEQETNSLKRIGDSFRKVVVVRDDIIPWHDEHGILFVGLEQFLLVESALDL